MGECAEAALYEGAYLKDHSGSFKGEFVKAPSFSKDNEQDQAYINDLLKNSVGNTKWEINFILQMEEWYKEHNYVTYRQLFQIERIYKNTQKRFKKEMK